MKRLLQLCCVAVVSFGLVGCETKAGSGALIGGASGAAIGGLIGANSDSRAGEGALIGGAIGAIGGGLIGHGLDEQDRRDAQQQRDHERDFDRRNYTQSGWRESSNNAVSQGDVIAWTTQGVRDDIIIDRIERSGVVFRLSAADQNDLRDRGVSEEVIRATKNTGRR